MGSGTTGKYKIKIGIAALALIVALAVATPAAQAALQNAATEQIAASNRIALQNQAECNGTCLSCERSQVRLQERAAVNASEHGDQLQERQQARTMNCASGDCSGCLVPQGTQQAQQAQQALHQGCGSGCSGNQEQIGLKSCVRAGK